MVFFVCSSCGASLKKVQVSPHLNHKCRSASVSCMDCSKDFGREEYATHYTCISENKKYGASDYVEKRTKGQIQQEETKVIFEKCTESLRKDPTLKEKIERILSFQSIPRKEKQFRNFVRPFNIPSAKINLIFNTFQEAYKKSRQSAINNKENEKGVEKSSQDENKSENPLSPQDSNENEKVERKNKRERKEERQMKQSKKSKKDKRKGENESEVKKSEVENDKLNKSGKKSKKRKLEEESENLNISKKKKKSEKMSVDSATNGHCDAPNGNADDSILENGCNGRLNATLVEETPKAFKWKTSIRHTLEQGPAEGMKLKKLEKKVLAHYLTAGGENGHILPNDQLKCVFKKKVMNEKFLVKNEFISLRKE